MPASYARYAHHMTCAVAWCWMLDWWSFIQACALCVCDCHPHCVAGPQDADLDLTAKNIIKGGYSYSGQRCTAVKLVLAHEAIADKLVEKVCFLPVQLTLHADKSTA